MSNNPKLKKNGGKGTFVGNLLRGIVKIGKTVSPQFKGLMDSVQGVEDLDGLKDCLSEQHFSASELEYLIKQIDLDKVELEETTKRWESDNASESWLPKNVRPMTLIMFNVCLMAFIFCDSYVPGFNVESMWINILLSNTGIINTAYFGSRYLEKRDSKKYK